MHYSTDRITATTPFGTPVLKHWLELEIAQCVRFFSIVEYFTGGAGIIYSKQAKWRSANDVGYTGDKQHG